MTRQPDGRIHFAAVEWAKLVLALLVHAAMVFGALLYWTNRIVIVETKVQSLEYGQNMIYDNLRELRGDIKTLIRKTEENGVAPRKQ